MSSREFTEKLSKYYDGELQASDLKQALDQEVREISAAYESVNPTIPSENIITMIRNVFRNDKETR